MNTATLIDFDEQEELDRELEPEPPERTREERRAWHREGIEGLRELRRTGLHLTGEEVDAWLDAWGNEEFTEPPECHT